jgi:HEAT repeats
VNDLFDVFRADPLDVKECNKAVADLVALPASEPVVDEAWEFLAAEQQDEVRTWAITVVRERPEADTFERLVKFVRAMDTAAERRQYKYGRLFALKALAGLADTPEREAALDELLAGLWADPEEDALPRALAAAIGTVRGKRLARDALNERFEAVRDDPYWWSTWAVLRALRESPVGSEGGPLAELAGNQLLTLIRDRKGYLDHRHTALELIGSFPVSTDVVRGVGEVLVTDPNEYLRLRAAETLNTLAHKEAWRDLLEAVSDRNAEVRVRAAAALERSLGGDQAIAVLVNAALEDAVDDREFDCLAGALRQLDRRRERSTALISKEMAGDDRDRVQRGERMLLELGGWSAVQQLARRQTLEQLDKLLQSSEQVVQKTFEGMIRQARINFGFALAVNVLIVLAGVALLVIAIFHLISEPDDWADWLVPGSGGFIGIVLGRFFNDPRRNAREDLATLVNVNVLFLGFLRQVNQIDATFKHAYIESRTFGSADMEVTVASIERAVTRALQMVALHLRSFDADAPRTPGEWEPEPASGPNGDAAVAPAPTQTGAVTASSSTG